MDDYLRIPWTIEDTIENLNVIRENIARRLRKVNLHGKAEQDVAELNFDFNRAINALKENQQYRQIGTLEECREARNRQQAMKVTNIKGNDKLKFCTCPSCGKNISNVEGGNYCQNCGQALSWEEAAAGGKI